MRLKVSILPLLSAGVILAGCQVDGLATSPYYTLSENKAETPLSLETRQLIAAKGMDLKAPIMIRIIKEEHKLEVWKQQPNDHYAHLKDYEICAWSGEIGRKKKEGDRQAPEGFYHITPALMNPYSSFFLAFNTGFPNTYDRAHGFTGSHLMVHGACSSRGCYSMTNEQIGEIYALARDAFDGGQKAFQMQAIPFRLTPENLARHHDHPEFDFWMNIKEGMDHFEITKVPPAVDVCDKRYVFNAMVPKGERMSPRRACPEYSHPANIAVALAEINADDTEELEVRIAREERQKAFKQRLSFTWPGAQEPDAGSSVEDPADATTAAVETATVSDTAGIPIPRPRFGTVVQVEPEKKGFGFGRLFGRRSADLEAEQPDPAVAAETEAPDIQAPAPAEAAVTQPGEQPAPGASGQIDVETSDDGSTQVVDAAAASATSAALNALGSPMRHSRKHP